MAKRRLYGAALAAYNRKRGRSSTALARRSSGSIARRGSQHITVRVAGVGKRRRGRRRRGGGGGGLLGGLGAETTSLLHFAKTDGLGSAAYGFIRNDKSDIALQLNELLEKLPTVDSVGKPASHGILLHVGAKMLPRSGLAGLIRKAASTVSRGALNRAFYNLGSTGFDMEAAAAMGYDDDDMFAGEMDDVDDESAGDDADDAEIEGDEDAGDPEA